MHLLSPLFRLASLTFLSVVACSAAPGSSEDIASTGANLSTGPYPLSCDSNEQCTANQFCDTEPPDGEVCGGRGLCEARGDGICPYIDEHLCGCDGKPYGNGCFAHLAGTSINDQPFEKADISQHRLDHTFVDASETFFYTFHADGTFVEQTAPPCTRAQPHCDIVAEPQDGTYTLHDSRIELSYESGASARFESKEDCYDAWELVGQDFSQKLTLTETTVVP